MATNRQDTTRAVVKTRVPAYQRDVWDEEAAELDMSRSEFVRSMVQAGRRGFDPRGNGPETTSDGDEASDDAEPSASGPRSTDGNDDSFDELVLELLGEECLSWEDLFEALTDDVERRLDDALTRLQAENEIQHSGRRGGYVRLE